MKVKLGLYAISFGFGPVSKAVAIARAVIKQIDVEWYLIGSGISLEFMKREGIKANIIDISNYLETELFLKDLKNKIDGAIVVMDNDWANKLAPHIPVFFADSLGFIWNKEDFKSFSNMGKIKKYYVQNLFGAYDNLLKIGFKNIKAISPIIDVIYPESSNFARRNVIHLGGLMNPLNPNTTKIYLNGIIQIIIKLKINAPLFLMSDAAKMAFPSLLKGCDIQSLTHKEAIAAVKYANSVWSSPGLTIMLEMAHMRVKTIPLPPQNYSQVLNIRNMVREFKIDLPEIWHFLDQEYSEITMGMPEEIGVQKITELNSKKLTDNDFQNAFSQLARHPCTLNATLPEKLISQQNGANEIAQDIKEFFC